MFALSQLRSRDFAWCCAVIVLIVYNINHTVPHEFATTPTGGRLLRSNEVNEVHDIVQNSVVVVPETATRAIISNTVATRIGSSLPGSAHSRRRVPEFYNSQGGSGFSEQRKACFKPPCLAMGTAYGGYTIPITDKLPANPTYYGFGCGEDISFDLVLAARYPDMKMHLFDPTPRALAHMAAVMETISTGEIPQGIVLKSHTYLFKGKRQEISGRYSAKAFFDTVVQLGLSTSQFEIKPWGLWDNVTTLKFNAPASGVSHTLETVKTNSEAQSGALQVSVFTLESLMKHFGDTAVDILKMDIEGAEIQVVPHLISFFAKKKLWPTVWCFDLDIMRPLHPAYNEKAGEGIVLSILANGYSLASCESGMADVCFLKD